MKKIICLIFVLLLVCFSAGCNQKNNVSSDNISSSVASIDYKTTEKSFDMKDFGIMVKMEIAESFEVTGEFTSLIFKNKGTEDMVGMISVSKVENSTLDKIYNSYFLSGEIVKTKISDNLIFADVTTKGDSPVLGGNTDKTRCFLFYDKKNSIALYGRFFENCDRNMIMELAKSVKVVKK